MIHSTESEFTQSGPKACTATRPSHRAHRHLGTQGRSHSASVSSPIFSVAEPEISSLWDAGLLDRLSSPLTRYHE
jgi:hypothetical protein